MRFSCLRFTLQLGTAANVIVVHRIWCPDCDYAALASCDEQIALSIVQTVPHYLFVAHKVCQRLERVLGRGTDRSQDLTEKDRGELEKVLPCNGHQTYPRLKLVPARRNTPSSSKLWALIRLKLPAFLRWMPATIAERSKEITSSPSSHS